jgi:isoleucyl-tRNA synthetase
VYLGDYVTLDTGTGVVHTAHQPTAWRTSSPASATACATRKSSPRCRATAVLPSLPFFGGLNVWKANPAIIEKLREVGCLFASNKITHSYMHCWRHKTPIIYRATSQWFVGMDRQPVEGRTLRETALQPSRRRSFSPTGARRACTP